MSRRSWQGCLLHWRAASAWSQGQLCNTNDTTKSVSCWGRGARIWCPSSVNHCSSSVSKRKMPAKSDSSWEAQGNSWEEGAARGAKGQSSQEPGDGCICKGSGFGWGTDSISERHRSKWKVPSCPIKSQTPASAVGRSKNRSSIWNNGEDLLPGSLFSPCSFSPVPANALPFWSQAWFSFQNWI